MDSYDYMLTYEAITVDSRMTWRAETPHGYYWKTFDIFTQGESDYQRWNSAHRAVLFKAFDKPTRAWFRF